MNLVDYVVLYYLRNFDTVRYYEPNSSCFRGVDTLLLSSEMFVVFFFGLIFCCNVSRTPVQTKVSSLCASHRISCRLLR